MNLVFTWKEILVRENGRTLYNFPASCDVRNELNNRRKLNNPKEVVKTFPYDDKRKPYMPRQFPSGIFKIIGIEWTDEPEFAPCKIKTTASREVFTWKLDNDGCYKERTDEIQVDTAYWMHHSNYKTTLGCIRIDDYDHAEKLGMFVEELLNDGETLFIEVL